MSENPAILIADQDNIHVINVNDTDKTQILFVLPVEIYDINELYVSESMFLSVSLCFCQFPTRRTKQRRT